MSRFRPVPLVLLSHRRREFLETALDTIHTNLAGFSDIVIVDDSGDEDHYDWLDGHFNGSYSIVRYGENAGYYEAMQRVWSVAAEMADEAGVGYAMLWEEDFHLIKPVDISDMVKVMGAHSALAQLNLQRQPVYRVEHQYGYMQSHERRGYDLSNEHDRGVDWVSRMRPFTTNPGLIRREVLDIDWPSREECDNIEGGAEPAMSLRLESDDWYFGWLGRYNKPATFHVGHQRKTGKGY